VPQQAISPPAGNFHLDGGLVVANSFMKGMGGTFSGSGSGTLRVNMLGGFVDLSMDWNLEIGHAGGAGSGSYQLDPGRVLSVRDLTVGYDAPASFLQTGGSCTVAGNLMIGPAGSYLLAGGSLVASGVANGGGILVIDGGTLQGGAGFASAVSLTINASGAAVDTNGADVTLAGNLIQGTGAGDLTKSGAGTLTFCGENTYAGGTTVVAGTLKVDNAAGSGTSAGAVIVRDGATLAGWGIIGGPVIVESGGSLAPGVATGGLAAGALILDDEATLCIAIDSANITVGPVTVP